MQAVAFQFGTLIRKFLRARVLKSRDRVEPCRDRFSVVQEWVFSETLGGLKP